CKRQISRYTCPACNAPYCSLTCFKSDAHAECSESFYRKEIETDIKVAPDKSSEERRNMMHLLKRFEEEAASGPDNLDGEEETDDLAQKLEDSADTEALWSVLSPAQRETFLKAMRDPSSEFTQELLASDALHKGFRKPWWESPSLGMNQESADASAYGRMPRMMTVQLSITSSTSRQSLLYNIVALCLVYVYVTRRLSLSPLSSLDGPDRAVARDLFSTVATFITERRSTLVFRSVDDMVTHMWATISAAPTHAFFSALLSDAARLLQPHVVSVLADGSASCPPSQAPFTMPLLVISDVAALFAGIRHVSHKLAFYAAYVSAQSAALVSAVSEETRLSAAKHAAAAVPQ
ncbi:hypothetical protein BU17DRAFT_47847, partial [Hysterangium stoloniferum]